MKTLFLLLFLASTAAFAGDLQNADFATPAAIVGAGGTTAQLLNTSNVFDSTNTQLLDTTIAGKQPNITTSTAGANQFCTGFTSPNTFTYAQPSFSNLSGAASAAQMFALASGDIYIGDGSNHPSAQAMSGGATIGSTGIVTLGNPGPATLGGVESLASVSHNFLIQISTSGVPSAAQPAFTDISGSATGAQMLALASGDIYVGSGGSVPVAQAMSGDATITSGGVVTVGKVDGVSYPATPSTNTVPVVTSSNTITYEAVPNAALANASTTVNGQTCTLGSTCTITASNGTATQEVPGGTVDGTNVTFTLAHTPTVAANLSVFEDGLIQVQGVDYTISSGTITEAVAPELGQTLYATYIR